jgi:AcrR family transcriptional regulator
MRGIADAVGVTPMALYHHVRDRKDLLSGMVEQVLAEVPDTSSVPSPWNHRLRSQFLNLRSLGHAHPRVVPLVLHHHRTSAQMRRLEESGLQVIVDAGVPPGQVVRTWAMVWTVQLGFVVREALGHFRDQPPGGADRDAAAALALVDHYVTWVATHPDRAHPHDPGTEWSPHWEDD